MGLSVKQPVALGMTEGEQKKLGSRLAMPSFAFKMFQGSVMTFLVVPTIPILPVMIKID
jgi:hypothetical protein